MQNINLYIAELRPEKKFLTANTLAISMLCCLMLMGGISVFAHLDVSRYEKSVAAMEAGKASEKETVERIKAQSPRFIAERVDQEIAQLRNKVSYLTRVYDLIGSQRLGNDAGYSQRLQDLAAASDNEISLSAFRFSSGARKVELLGVTRSPMRVTDYVEQLTRSASFANAKFGPLTINQSSKGIKEHGFSFGYEGMFDSSTQLVDAVR